MQHTTTSDTSMWVQFFKDASIPSQYVQSYANKFTENRIRFDMLQDLDRPLLNELGISAIGDCLSILKHAKTWTPKLPDIIESKSAKSTKTVASCIPSFSTATESTNSEKPIKSAETLDKPEKLNSAISSNLSASLVSRLNFNPQKSVHERVTPAVSVEEENKAPKRKLNCTEESVGSSTRSVLEYRTFSKTAIEPKEKTIIRLVNNKRILSVDDEPKIKRTISMDPSDTITLSSGKAQAATNSGGITITKSSGTRTIQPIETSTKFTKKVASLQSDLISKSVFDRINVPIEESRINQPFQTKTPQSKITITLNNTKNNDTKKQNFVPIKFSENKKTDLNRGTTTKLSSIVRTVNQANHGAKRQNRDLFSRISL